MEIVVKKNFVFIIDPELYSVLSERIIEKPDFFKLLDHIYRDLKFNRTSLQHYNRYLKDIKYYSSILGGDFLFSRFNGERFFNDFSRLYRNLIPYRHFFREASTAIKFNLLSTKHKDDGTMIALYDCLKKYVHLIKPMVIYSVFTGIIDRDGMSIKDTEWRFETESIRRFFFSGLKDNPENEYMIYQKEFKESSAKLTGEKSVEKENMVLFLATIGPALDETVKKLQAEGKIYEAFILNGIGAGAAECVAEDLNLYFNSSLIADEEKERFRRISPGYADWPLREQRKIFEILQPEKRLGVTLTESSIMIPEKSVTGIMGIKIRDIG